VTNFTVEFSQNNLKQYKTLFLLSIFYYQCTLPFLWTNTLRISPRETNCNWLVWLQGI